MLYWSGGVWIFSGITQYKTNEIGLISYFVYVLGGFNPFAPGDFAEKRV